MSATPQDDLRAAYDAGFEASGEGWNGEYPAGVMEEAGYKMGRAQWIAHFILDAPVASAPAPSDPAGAGGDLVSYLHRQWTWSKETFGPALRTKGIVQHITKELREIEAEPHDLAEWVDVIILAMDGFWRHGGKPEDLLPAMQAKQDKNFARQWPDWRTIGEDQAIEHDRSSEGSTPAQTPPSPPSATPEGDPPMTVEEARKILNLPKWCGPEFLAETFRQNEMHTYADCIELALRTLQASESPSTKEASDA